MKALIYASLVALAATSASAQSVDTKDPETIAKALVGLGYKPTAVQNNGTSPILTAEINSWNTAFVFGGCEAGKNCKYIILVSSFLDLKNPPKEWVNKVNGDVDLGKLWVNDDLSVSFSLSIPAGGDPLATTSLRYALDQWTALIQYISRSAVDEKLIK